MQMHARASETETAKQCEAEKERESGLTRNALPTSENASNEVRTQTLKTKKKEKQKKKQRKTKHENYQIVVAFN